MNTLWVVVLGSWVIVMVAWVVLFFKWRTYFKKSAQPAPQSVVTEASKSPEPEPEPQKLPDLTSEQDELVAARFRATVENAPQHPIQEPLKKAFHLFCREWGMTVTDYQHNLYDFVQVDKHTVSIRLECQTKKTPSVK